MGSVNDLIRLAEFQQAQRNPPAGQDMGTQYQNMLAQVEAMNQKRRFQENQKRLSDMITKNLGGLEAEYSVDESGRISVKYKSKKKTTGDFAEAVKEASERIKTGGDYSKEALDLETRFPTKFTSQIEKHLKKSLGVKEEKRIKEPTWKQQATIDAIKSDLSRKRGTTYSLMGEPQPFEMKTAKDAVDYISQRGYSPELFRDELAKFGVDSGEGGDKITVQDAQGNKFYLPSEQLEEAIKQGYKQVK